MKWHIDGTFDADVEVDIVDEEGNPVVALAPFYVDWDKADIAKAHLIAAAPELLDACRIASVRLAAGQKPLDAPIIKILDAAIDKAQGTLSTVEKSQADGSQKANEAKK